MPRALCLVISIICSGDCGISLAQQEISIPADPPQIDFARDIRPLLQAHCWSCHGAEKQESGLRLDRRSSIRTGGDLGRILVPGNSSDSRLIHLVSGKDPDNVMPPEGNRLSPADVSRLAAWIDQGAEIPDDADDSSKGKTHWAYQPLKPTVPPSVTDSAWPMSPIDNFVLANLEANGISPSPEADRHTLIRRLSLDLTGLLPSWESAEAFAASPEPDAYEQLVDRLLASPHFGERWGRHWLDMARYADSDGYEKDNPRPDAYLWRDWVISAINADMPFDQFTVEQLAGDLLPEATRDQRLATAFHRQTLTNTEGGTDQEQFRVEACFDRTETTGTVWLGLTVGCARCHTHKYDAITQREYYQLFAVFNNADETTIAIPKSEAEVAAYDKAKADYDQKLAELMKAAPDRKLDAAIAKLKKEEPSKPQINARILVHRDKDPRTTFVLKRGEFLEPITDLAVAPAGFETLPPMSARTPNQAADRLDLARWLVSDDNPLTPRVAVNHIWRALFGHGIVRTSNDFGVRGDQPTHPQLLDWLAAEFIREKWSRKQLIRSIVLSATYRQSSRHRAELTDADPDNLLLARQNRFRVEGEIVRDISLDAAGLLSRRIGGPSVYPPLPPGIAELSYAGNFKWNESTGEDRYRRGMYTFFKRTSPHPNLTTFDCPDANLTCVERTSSNTPLQALTSLNNATFTEAARALGGRLLAAQVEDDQARMQLAFQLCLTRRMTSHEYSELNAMREEAGEWYRANPEQAALLTDPTEGAVNSADVRAAWITVARIMLNLDEFITRQ